MPFIVECNGPRGWETWTIRPSMKLAIDAWRDLIFLGFDSRVTWEAHERPEDRQWNRRPMTTLTHAE
jgi:hypothetical protein